MSYARQLQHSRASHGNHQAGPPPPKMMNPIAAAAMEQAQWTMANGYGTTQQVRFEYQGEVLIAIFLIS